MEVGRNAPEILRKNSESILLWKNDTKKPLAVVKPLIKPVENIFTGTGTPPSRKQLEVELRRSFPAPATAENLRSEEELKAEQELGLKVGLEVGKEAGLEVGKEAGLDTGREVGEEVGLERFGPEMQGMFRINVCILCGYVFSDKARRYLKTHLIKKHGKEFLIRASFDYKTKRIAPKVLSKIKLLTLEDKLDQEKLGENTQEDKILMQKMLQTGICVYCSSGDNLSNKDLASHLWNEHNKKLADTVLKDEKLSRCTFSCSVCSKIFSNKSKLEEHENTRHGREDHPAEIVEPQTMQSKQEVEEKKEISEEIIQSRICVICQNKKFSDKTSFLFHLRKKHYSNNENIQSYFKRKRNYFKECQVCRDVFRDNADLTRHSQTHGYNETKLKSKFIKVEKESQDQNKFSTEKKKGRKCSKQECRDHDCGICSSCKDKPKFGGPGTRKQKCWNKTCQKKTMPAIKKETAEVSIKKEHPRASKHTKFGGMKIKLKKENACSWNVSHTEINSSKQEEEMEEERKEEGRKEEGRKEEGMNEEGRKEKEKVEEEEKSGVPEFNDEERSAVTLYPELDDVTVGAVAKEDEQQLALLRKFSRPLVARQLTVGQAAAFTGLSEAAVTGWLRSILDILE